jgi:hypothetical protein
MLRRDVELLPYQNVSDNASRKGYNVQYFNSGSVQLLGNGEHFKLHV